VAEDLEHFLQKPRSEMTPLGASSVSLRPFPYPYRAALAICNDADLLTPERYRRIHRFLSTDAETEWGPGLRLRIGGSFFMFRSPQSPNAFTVFDGLTNRISEDGEFILDGVRAGDLDVLHTYGCFTDPTHFTRRLAETALDALSSRGIKIETWVNHGTAANVQGLGGNAERQGDIPGTSAYHADLTIRHGVRWLWTGTEMTDRIALDAMHPTRTRMRRFRRFSDRIRGRVDEQDVLVEPYTLRDGQRVRRFYRYTGLSGRTPVLEDLPAQLSDARLDELTTAGGYAVVYQHLAVRRVRPGFGTAAYRPVDDHWFQPAELAALRGLAERYHRGEIWVAPTTRLLRQRDLLRDLRWVAHREATGDVIVITRESRSSLDDLADLTFYCERPEATRIYLKVSAGLEPVDDVRVNPADVTSRRSVTVLPQSIEGRPQ
jgi:hypothetical protein